MRTTEMKKHEHGTSRIPETAHACTMIWTSDGKIMVIGDPDDISSVHDKYEDAEKAFLKCADAIKNNKRYSDGQDIVDIQISHALDMVKKSFESKMMVDQESAKKFLISTILTVQLMKIGKSAYVIHNMETFKFMSDLSGIEMLVPELFLAVPKGMNPHDDQPYRDPEILKLLEQMKKKETP